MCGLVGVASRDPLPRDELPERMRDVMRHRGPDDAGLWRSSDGKVWLGLRRLAIVDLSPGGHQPMADGTGQLHIVFNGEIYNHRALRDELRGLGHRFRSSSDTEVILEAYRAWGTGCLERLNGMFSFALQDAGAGLVFLARDRAGEKPLFFYHAGGRLRFASELKALLEDPAVPRRVSLEAFNHYLAYGYVPGDGCILDGARKLRQGEAMTYHLADDTIRSWRYWQLPQISATGAVHTDLIDELESLLRESVRLRLDADVPVGLLLSGGIDSSLVTAFAAEVSPRPVRTFTVSFPGHGQFDEAPHARLVADHFGTDHTLFVAEPTTMELLPAMAEQFDEPLADSSMIPTYLISQLIGQHAKVAVAGDGGDELFGGYTHYSWLLRHESLRRALPRPLRAGLAQLGEAALPMGFRGRNYLAGLGGLEGESVSRVNLLFDARARRHLVPSLRGLACADLLAPETLKTSIGRNRASLVDQATTVDFSTYLVDDILVKVDRSSMLASLEVRTPWLDPRVIEFAFARVPAHLKATGSQRKILPRGLAKRLLPSTLDVSRKQGFSLPLERWFHDGWGDQLESVLLDGGQSPFRRKEVERILTLQRRGYGHNAHRLFALAIFELWRRRYGMDVVSA